MVLILLEPNLLNNYIKMILMLKDINKISNNSLLNYIKQKKNKSQIRFCEACRCGIRALQRTEISIQW